MLDDLAMDAQLAGAGAHRLLQRVADPVAGAADDGAGLDRLDVAVDGVLDLARLSRERRVDLTPLVQCFVPVADRHARREVLAPSRVLDRVARRVERRLAGGVREQAPAVVSDGDIS